MSKIKQMLQLQQQLNDATSGKGWENGLTNRGKIIDWKRCIYLETAELVDSYPWKHWKNIDAEPDYENIKIEVVDIWHFVMSEALRRYKVENKGSLDDLANDIEQLPAYDYFKSENQDNNFDIYEQIERIERLIYVLFTHKEVSELLNAFLSMSADLNINLNELYNLYVGKNILNQFRQDHGYKEGKYIKEWNGVEDNVVMQQLMYENGQISPGELYELLEKNYPN